MEFDNSSSEMGNCIVKVVPCFGMLCAEIDPPIASIIDLLINKPKPVDSVSGRVE